MKDYNIADTIILRTPVLPIDYNISWDKIYHTFQMPIVQEALFIASPDLSQKWNEFLIDEASLDKREKKSLQISLYKYYSRICNRCTPFGLFAFVSTLKTSKETKILVEEAKVKKSLQFDTFFLAQLKDFILRDKVIREELLYFPNTSVYMIGDKYRYVEYYLKKDKRLHRISAVDHNEYLEAILSQAVKKVSFNNLVSVLLDKGIEDQDARQYINLLIDNQFIVSELEINLTGEEYLSRLITVFQEERFTSNGSKKLRQFLLKLRHKLKEIENKKFVELTEYHTIFKFLENTLASVRIDKLFQMDGFKIIEAATLEHKYLKKIRLASSIINKLFVPNKNEALDHFKNQFIKRYEEYEMPLIQVLDPDVGIGYGKLLAAKTPLIEGLSIKRTVQNEKIPWSKKDSMLMQKINNAFRKDHNEIVLTDKDLSGLSERPNAYSDTFSIFFTAFKENNIDKVEIKGLWSPTASSLIGRFTHLDDSIFNLYEQINKEEKRLNPEAIIAEIVHLPQSRVGNVMHRKNLREYEIAYLSIASVPLDQQININDILISVKQNRVILRSKKYNKQIIPRLSNAHNYVADPLPIYHFLCDLQAQQTQSMAFHWGALYYNYNYLPRLTYDGILFSRETWLLKKQEIDNILNTKGNQVALVKELKKLQLPNQFAIVKGDNEVVINLLSDLGRQTFWSMIKNSSLVEIKEIIQSPESITNGYANEMIATAVRKENNSNNLLNDERQQTYYNKDVQKTYSIGDEWLYYKIYCGDKSVDRILKEAITPAVAKLTQQRIISQWFFIRYIDDGGYHIRLRLRLRNQNLCGQCILSIQHYSIALEKIGLIWKIQIDKYMRETERYGYDSIEAVEELYYHDSQCTLQFLNIIEGDEGERLRWIFALLSMNCMLDDFDFSLVHKAQLMERLKLGFGKEFNRTGLLNKQINNLYTKNKDTISSLINQYKVPEQYSQIYEILDQRSNYNKASIAKIKVFEKNQKLPIGLIDYSIPSYLHMICNRIFLTNQRIHEMVVYDFLYREYMSIRFRKSA